MKLMNCPLNGPRNIQEFLYGGEVVEEPDPEACSDAEWSDYVFLESNETGVVREWWYHVPTAYWFIAERNTVTDEIVRTYEVTKLFNKRVEYRPLEDAGDKGKAAGANPAQGETGAETPGPEKG